jgi:hypothetical protein
MPPKKDANVTFTPAPPKPYLLSSKTRARLAADSSSASSSSSADMSAPSIPVSSPSAVAASEPLAPESSSSKPATLTDRVASTTRDLLNVLSSPPSRHSTSDASMAGPSSRAGSPIMTSRGMVGESARASISPGAPASTPDMQLMMNMMQQQMREMMRSIETNMTRLLRSAMI